MTTQCYAYTVSQCRLSSHAIDAYVRETGERCGASEEGGLSLALNLDEKRTYHQVHSLNDTHRISSHSKSVVFSLHQAIR
jgi:hypothetical protein